MSKSNAVSLSVYKDLICSMIREERDERFIRQIYSIVRRHQESITAAAANVAAIKEVKE